MILTTIKTVVVTKQHVLSRM